MTILHLNIAGKQQCPLGAYLNNGAIITNVYQYIFVCYFWKELMQPIY
jgi:hypothetical protein